RTDAAHTDHFVGNVLHLEAIQQLAMIVAERLAIFSEGHVYGVDILLRAADHLMENQRWVVLDTRCAAVNARELWEIILEHRARGRLRDPRLDFLSPFLCANRTKYVARTDALVPAFHNAHLRKVVHVRAITVDAPQRHVACFGLGKPIMLTRDGAARRQ